MQHQPGIAMSPARTALVLIAVLLVSACGGGSSSSQVDAPTPLSVVVIGDSIASGEGINYGYTYYTGFPNEWTGGTDNPAWQGPYPQCHDSAQAYGDVLAAQMGAKLSKFACTGSTYDTASPSIDARPACCFVRPSSATGWG